MRGVQHVDAIKQLDLPIWSHRVWQATVQLVPLALDEAKIREVHRHHHKLDDLSALKGLGNQRLSERAKVVEAVVMEILKTGNPLKERTGD